MKITSGLLVFSLTLLLIGCQATVPMASLGQDADAKSFSSDPESAALYIWNEPPTGALATVRLNGDFLGQASRGTYFRLKLAPGNYLVESKGGEAIPFVLPISVQAGKRYFVHLEGDFTTATWNRLTLLEDAIGRAGVNASKMISSEIPDEQLRPLKGNHASFNYPLAIAVYFSPEFKNAFQRSKIPLLLYRSESYEIPIGQASQLIFERALEDSFKSVSILPEWSPSAPVSATDLILVPRVTNSTYDHRHKTPTISYQVSVHLPGKGEIATIALEGFSLNNTWSSAIVSAAAQLIASLDKLPEVTTRGKADVSPKMARSEKSEGYKDLESRTKGISIVPLLGKPESIQPAKEIQACLESFVFSNRPYLRLVPEYRVRAAAFPWLEAGMTPSQEDLRNILGQTAVAKQLEHLGVHFVLFPTIEYVDNKPGGPLGCSGLVCLGVAVGDVVTRFSVPVWDAVTGAMLTAAIAGEKKGVSWIVGIYFPIWNFPDTLGEACSEIFAGFASQMEPRLVTSTSDISVQPDVRSIDSVTNKVFGVNIDRDTATSASGHTNTQDLVATIDSGQAGFRKIEMPRNPQFLVTDIRWGVKLERTGLGGKPMGKITLQPPVPELIRLAVEPKIVDALERAGITEPQTVHCVIRIFDIKTPVTLLYWDVNTTIELALRVGDQERVITGAATERTYIWASQEMIERVTTKALQQVSAEAERALIELFSSHQ
jgi:hypothetical protein